MFCKQCFFFWFVSSQYGRTGVWFLHPPTGTCELKEGSGRDGMQNLANFLFSRSDGVVSVEEMMNW